METHLVELSDWMIIKISGSEATDYLHGIITLDITQLKDGEIKRSAFLTPKAKIKSIFWIKKNVDEYIIYCPSEYKTALVEDLLKFKLAMKVTLEDITEEVPKLYLLFDSHSKIPGLSNKDLGYKFIHLDLSSEDDVNNLKNDYNIKELKTISYSDLERILTLNYIMPPKFMLGENPFELGAADMIALEKGCFLGQEPLSRMYHRGNPRKFVHKIQINGSEVKPEILTQDDQEVGQILAIAEKGGQSYGLAYIKKGIKEGKSIKYNKYVLVIGERVGSYPSIWLN